MAVEVEFVPATSTSTAPAHPPPHQQSSHLQEKKQRVKSVRQKESQALPKVDLADDLASTENEVGLATFHINNLELLIISSQRFS